MIDKITLKVILNRNLMHEIEKLAIKIDVDDGSKRNMLYAGFFRISLNHYLAINILAEKRIYASAFALVRVLFDSVVRALYLYDEFDKTEIDKIYEGKSDFSKTEVMCKKLDAIAEISFFDDIRDREYGTMCDYTHTGSMQISQTFCEAKATIESSFSDELILDMLEGIEALVKVLALHYFGALGLKEKKITKEEMDVFLKYIDTIEEQGQ